MDAKDKSEFQAYLRACTDAQVEGVWEKEDKAGREDYASLAAIEADKRGIVLPDQHVDSGYTDCACRDCFEIAIGVRGSAMCNSCEEAGCDGEGECESPDAYGGNSEEESANE
jgi:hypothetical protein